MIDSVPEHRFGETFVADFRRKWSQRAVQDRPLTYDIAILDEFAERRTWYAEQVGLLPERDGDVIGRRLWDEEKIWPCTFELAAGAWLRAVGFGAVYEQDWDGLTPDWTVVNADGTLAAFLEVHTDQPRHGTPGRIRAWNSLAQRIATIPVPLVLTLAAPRKNAAPDAGTARRIVFDLKRALLRLQPQTMVTTNGYMFIIMADRRCGGLLQAVNGLQCEFLPPSGIAGLVSPRRIAHNALVKVSRYTALADKHNVPLIVATGAHPFTGVDLDDFDGLLSGKQTITFQFNVGDTEIGDQTVTLGQPETWQMPPELSGVVWLDNRFPFNASVRANLDASFPLDHRFRDSPIR